MFDPAPWTRPFYERGGMALLVYVVYGKFQQPLNFSPERYECGEPPALLDLRLLTPEQTPNGKLPFLWEEPDYFGRLLREQAPDVADAVLAAPECLVLQLADPDPADLEYLRDTLGVICAAVDSGGLAVLDVQAFRWFDGETWKREFQGEAGAAVHGHVSVFNSEDEGKPETFWVHTRGMRKFGRPDLSMRGVTPQSVRGVLELMNRLVAVQALGHVIPEGEQIQLNNRPTGLRCYHGGSMEDPEFNNVHVEVR